MAQINHRGELSETSKTLIAQDARLAGINEQLKPLQTTWDAPIKVIMGNSGATPDTQLVYVVGEGSETMAARTLQLTFINQTGRLQGQGNIIGYTPYATATDIHINWALLHLSPSDNLTSIVNTMNFLTLPDNGGGVDDVVNTGSILAREQVIYQGYKSLVPGQPLELFENSFGGTFGGKLRPGDRIYFATKVITNVSVPGTTPPGPKGIAIGEFGYSIKVPGDEDEDGIIGLTTNGRLCATTEYAERPCL